MRSSISLLSLFALALASSTACVTPATNTTPKDPNFKSISGVVTVLPIPPSAAAPSFGKLNYIVTNALIVPTATSTSYILFGGLISTTPPCTTASCPWTAPSVGLSTAVTNGMYMQVNDYNEYTVNAGTIAPTFTPIATPSEVSAAMAGNATLNNLTAYALSAAGIAGISTVTGLDPNTLQARGTVVGVVMGPGASSVVANANVTVQDATVTLVFPNDAFTAPSGTGVTNSSGVFVALGPASGTTSIDTTFNVGANPNAVAAPTTVLPGVIVVQPIVQ